MSYLGVRRVACQACFLSDGSGQGRSSGIRWDIKWSGEFLFWYLSCPVWVVREGLQESGEIFSCQVCFLFCGGGRGKSSGVR